MKLREFANTLGLSYSTALRLFKRGDIPGAYKLSTGTIVVPNTAAMIMSNEEMKLSDFCLLVRELATQKLKESDRKHVIDVMSMSSHSIECE
jgi:hypothetical protein